MSLVGVEPTAKAMAVEESEDPGGDGENCQTDGDDATDGGNGSGTMDDIHLSVDGDDDADVDRGI